MQSSHGIHSQLLGELWQEQKEIYENYRSMIPEHFKDLLGYIMENILKEQTHLKESIPLKSN